MIDGLNTYVSTHPFNDEFYLYTANGPSGNKGYLTLIPSASADNCPSGRTLYATGKKLTPGIHPMAFIHGQPNPNPVTLISVYDSISFLRGFIDPTSPTFTRPYITNSATAAKCDLCVPVEEPVAALPVAALPVAALPVAALPVAALPVAAVPVAALPATKLALAQRAVFPADDYSVNPAEAGSSSIGTITNIAGKLSMKINTSALTEDSMVFLTPLCRGPTLVAVSDIQPSTGQFTIAAGSVCTVNWLIVN
jgi:hypothetical protein